MPFSIFWRNLPGVPITIELPDLKSQTRFTLARWTEILTDPFLAKIPNRIESDRHSRIVMLPLSDVLHTRRLGSIAARPSETAANGTPLTICPVSTADSVKAVDVARLANAAPSELKENTEVLTKAPEICIEVVGRFDMPSEISERRGPLLRRQRDRGLDLQPRRFDIVFSWSRSSGF